MRRLAKRAPRERSVTSRPLYGDAAKVRRDLDAYREAGLDYLVVGLRQAKSADELSRAIGDVVAAIGR